jgi:hypothetical protein
MVRKADVWSSLPAGTKTPPGIKGDSRLLRMDVREERTCRAMPQEAVAT